MKTKRGKDWKKYGPNYEDLPDRFIKCNCLLCNSCTYDLLARKCICGGPFKEFVNSEGEPLNADGQRLSS